MDVALGPQMGILYNRSTTYLAALPHHMWLDHCSEAS